MNGDQACIGCHRPVGDLHEHHCAYFNPEFTRSRDGAHPATFGANRVLAADTTPKKLRSAA